MRVYISGPITGHDDFLERFREAEDYIENSIEGDVIVVNPAKLNFILPDGTHEEYMKICLALLNMSDAIYMLTGWGASKGACIEYGYALAQDKMIIEGKPISEREWKRNTMNKFTEVK